MDALVSAAFCPKFSYYQLTVHDMAELASVISEQFQVNGYKMVKDRDKTNNQNFREE